MTDMIWILHDRRYIMYRNDNDIWISLTLPVDPHKGIRTLPVHCLSGSSRQDC